MTNNQYDILAMLVSETTNKIFNIVGFKTDTELRERLRCNPKRLCQRLCRLYSTLKVARIDRIDAGVLLQLGKQYCATLPGFRERTQISGPWRNSLSVSDKKNRLLRFRTTKAK